MSQTTYPRSALGALDLVEGLSHLSGEWLSLLHVNLTLPLSKRGILSYTKLVTKVCKLYQKAVAW
jgi:hypothetical protein